ncbi:MAG: hypothetical protein ACRDHD_03465 [Candidatus Limnocylindria bacterium]
MPTDSSDTIQDIALAHLADANQRVTQHLQAIYGLPGVVERSAGELRTAFQEADQAIRTSIGRERDFPGRAAELPAEERERAWRAEAERFESTAQRALRKFDAAIPATVEALGVLTRIGQVSAAEQALARQDLEAAGGDGERLDPREIIELAGSSDARAHALRSAWGKALLRRAGLDPGPELVGVRLARAKAAGGHKAAAAEALEKLEERLLVANGALRGAVDERMRQHRKGAPRPRLR